MNIGAHRKRRPLARLAVLLLLTASAGCVEIEQEIHVNHDGSGKIVEKIALSPRGVRMLEGAARQAGQAAQVPALFSQECFQERLTSMGEVTLESRKEVKLPDGAWRLAFGNSGVHLLTPDGKELWRADIPEAQHIVAGRFCDESPAQFAVVERGLRRTATDVGTLHLFDLEGKRIWKKEMPPGSWGMAIEEIDWSGAGRPREILLYGLRPPGPNAIVCNAQGDTVDAFAVPFKVREVRVSGKEVCFAVRADVWGDSRQEVILYGPTGICIYANARPLAVPTLYNETFYTGM